jgi:predicted dehydrogenase
MSFTEKRFVFKSSWRCSEDELKLEKPNLDTWGTESITKQGLLHTEINEIKKKHIPTLRNYYDYFDGVFNSITNDIEEPVTATDGIHVMKIIEAAKKVVRNKK